MAALVVVFSTARASLADHYVVPTGSMRPTVEVGDRVVVDKRAFGLRVPLTSRYLAESDGPKRGDVVVLTSPEDGRVLLKRIAAVPGDRVEVHGGRVFIDGQAADVGPVRLTRGGGRDFGPVSVPDRQYLVLGDNRGDSLDGRYFGLVERSALLGRAEGIYFRGGDLTWRDL